MRMLFLAAIIASASGVPAQNTEQSEALAHASQRGALLYAYDQAAWHGTDDMLAKIKDPASKIGGYIVDGTAAAPRLIFFDKAGQAAVYIATFDGNRLVEGHVLPDTEDRTLSAPDRRMVQALGAARAAIARDSSVRPCTPQPFNTVVLPPERANGPIRVYFLTPQPSAATIPFGGHFSVEVDAAGRAGGIRRFTKTCIDMPVRPELPNGAKSEALFITHLLDPVPTEIHVFNSLSLRMPLMVGTTSKMIWPVQGAQIGEPVPMAR